MVYALLRVFYGVWIMGTIGFFALTLGTTLFSNKRGWKRLLKTVFRRLYHSVIWPIALLSAKGRKALLTDIEEGQ